MISISDNYIFIVGGNDKKTFYFDDNDSKAYNWADLNKERIEPALIRISNILYCFDKLNNENNERLTFEKTDLIKEKHEWILIKPKIDLFIKNQKLTQKYFCVASKNNNEIIFLGGNMENKENINVNNFKYIIDKNIIEYSDIHIPYKNYKFKEKTFLIYNKNAESILPDLDRQNPEVIFYIKNKNKIENVIFKLNTNILSSLNSKFDIPTIKSPDSFPDSIMSDNSKVNINFKNEMRKRPNSFRDPFHYYYNYEINIPIFHSNVNDPGNELIISRKGKICQNYHPKFTNRVKPFNGKIRNKNDNLFLPNFNFSEDFVDFKLNKIKPSLSQGKINNTNNKNNNENRNKCDNINEYNINGFIPGIKKNKNKYNNLNGENYILSGKIPGINSEKPKK